MRHEILDGSGGDAADDLGPAPVVAEHIFVEIDLNPEAVNSGGIDGFAPFGSGARTARNFSMIDFSDRSKAEEGALQWREQGRTLL